jgi:hypothetical protein
VGDVQIFFSANYCNILSATICPCDDLSMQHFVHATICPCDIFLATNCPRRNVRNDLSATICPATICPATICPCDELSATICPRPFVLQPFVLRRFVHATNCPQRFVRDDLSCDILSGHQEIKYEERYKVFFCLFHLNSDIVYPVLLCFTRSVHAVVEF